MRILLADLQPCCDELRALLRRRPGVTIVGEAYDGRATVLLARELEPDVVILELGLPELSGLEATRRIRALRPQTQVIAVSPHADQPHVTAMLAAGARGYVIKDRVGRELEYAVRTVHGGGRYLSPAIAGVVVDDRVRCLVAAEGSGIEKLSPPERAVLELLAKGHYTKAIAERLHLSRRAVETHRRSLTAKLDLHTVAELTRFAVRVGVKTPETRRRPPA